MTLDEKLYVVAIDYYHNKMTQQEIADQLNVSRVQVSKYLASARERGIVEITVNPPWVDDQDQERCQKVFKTLLGVDTLILSQKAQHEDIAYRFLLDEAVRYLNMQYAHTVLKIGVGWGKTIYDLSKNGKGGPHGKRAWELTPLVVAPDIDHAEEFFNYDTILRNFTSTWGAQSNKTFMNLLRNPTDIETHAESAFHAWQSLDLLIYGIGMPFTRFPGARSHIFSKEVRSKMATLDITGDVVNTFFDLDGNMFIPKIEDFITIPFDLIKTIPHRIAIAAGSQKVQSIIGACRSGLVETLITDVVTAKQVVEYLK